MGRLSYFFKRLVKMDWKAMWKTTGLLKERSGKSRLWLMADMLRCAIKYNAGYIDYKIAQMYRLNDAQRATVITRGISNSIVRRMNDKAYWHFFDDKTQFNALFREYIPRKWLLITPDTELAALEDITAGQTQLIGKPLEGSSGQGILKFTQEDWAKGPAAFKALLLEKRLSKAAQLLRETKLSTQDIIFAVGYENTSYFYRAFRARFGLTPREYRAQCGGVFLP